MVPLYVLALILHAAYSTEIVTKETKNPADLVGNWTYVYHWDNLNKFKWQFPNDKADHVLQCPGITIEPISPEYAKSKEAQCKDSVVPFNWADAKLRLDAPLMKMKGGILFMGDKDNWLMMECKRMVRVVVRKVSDDYILMVNPEMANISELMARKTPTLEELKHIVKNIDVGKGMSGFGLCV